MTALSWLDHKTVCREMLAAEQQAQTSTQAFDATVFAVKNVAPGNIN
jgi:hypothetical protein